jgi:sugar/nucleoside kinase (ribokinase family)
MPEFDVLVIGRSCVDHIAVVEAFPRENTKAAIKHRYLEGGGQGGTAAACIARLGGRVCYVGRVGDDDAGRICLQRLRAFGVDTGRVAVQPDGRTPQAHIVVTEATGDRTIFYEPNTLPRLVPDDWPPGLLDAANVLLLDPETTYLAEFLPQEGGPLLVYDAERWRDGMDTMMQTADFFIPSRDFFADERVAGPGEPLAAAMIRLRGRIPGQLVVTDGPRGAYYFDGNDIVQVPAPAVSVMDTTGAGDNFHAAFALAVSRGEPVPQAVRLAVAVASLSCRSYGGRNGVPAMADARDAAAALTVQRLPAAAATDLPG